MGVEEFAGKVAIVTGGGTGIGAATCLALARRGARVAVNYSRSAEEAEGVVADCAAAGAEAIAVRADLCHDDEARAVAAAAFEHWGAIDLLVNNAGKTKFADHRDLEALTQDDFLDIYRLNVVGAYQVVRACVPHLRRSKAPAIVNVASVAGLFGHGSSIAYAASKGAMITMTKSLARALAPEIRVNAVLPGYVATRWWKARVGDEEFGRLNARIAAAAPLRRAATAEDVADAILLFLDEGTRLVTGETLLVDGGQHLVV